MIPFSDQANWYIDSIVVIALFPLLVALGAGAKLAPLFSNSCKFLGDISYPLYIIHYPFLWLFLSYIETHQPSLLQMKIFTPIATVFLIALAYFAMKYIDTPLRKLLKSKVEVRVNKIERSKAIASAAKKIEVERAKLASLFQQ